MKVVARCIVFCIRIYQLFFSLKRPCCRFIPTCSVYAIQAITKHGAAKGSFLAARRVLRCRPGLGKNKNFGYDPVP